MTAGTWIVIPVFDEAGTIGDIVAAARVHAPVLVVDDGSTDRSAQAARVAGAVVVAHPRRRGKGEALLTGIAEARARGASVVLTLDGDGQHAAADVPILLAAVRQSPDAIVVGNRLGDAAPLPAGRLNAIRVAGFFTSWASGRSLGDTQSGFRAYPVRLFDEVRPRHGGFVLETEILVVAASRGWAIREVPVTAIPHAARQSRFRPLADGLAIAAYLAGRAVARAGVEVRAAVRAMLAAHDSGTNVRTGAGRPGDSARPRDAAAAVVATLAAPAVLLAALIQTVAERWVPDVLTPLVARLYAPGPPAEAVDR